MTDPIDILEIASDLYSRSVNDRMAFGGISSTTNRTGDYWVAIQAETEAHCDLLAVYRLITALQHPTQSEDAA